MEKKQWLLLLVWKIISTAHSSSSTCYHRSLLFQRLEVEQGGPQRKMASKIKRQQVMQPTSSALFSENQTWQSDALHKSLPSFEVKRMGQRIDDDARKIGWYPYTVLGLLMLVSLHNLWSRNLICYMVNFNVKATPAAAKELINIALKFDQASYSLLASFGFTLLYSVVSVFAGRAVDRSSKRVLVAGATAFWSLSTLGLAFAQCFRDVFSLRALTGVAQAFTNPVAYSLLSQIFPKSKRAFANSIYASGAYLGVGLASLTILLCSSFGWRLTAFGLGAMGMALSLLSFGIIKDEAAVKVPTSPMISLVQPQQLERRKASSFQGAIKEVLASPIVRVLLVASSFRFCVAYVITTWSAPYFRAAFPAYTSKYSLLNTLVVGSAGALSSTLGGLLSDRLVERDLRARAWVCAAGSLLAMPFWVAVCLTSNFYVAMFFLFLEYFVACCWFGPSTAILQDALPANVRGVGQGIFGLAISIGNIAPVMLGTLMTTYRYPLKEVLLWSVPALYFVSAVLFFLTGEIQQEQQALVQASKSGKAALPSSKGDLLSLPVQKQEQLTE
mmetsp:Transcript_29150/g.38338  ORF Transcript_29150/g.38338 Transcript_29150/m.38338 type:complete len:558 (+) Transcript_29150:197-1870(+)|eukprot:CAMPEP_0117752960 /NCGR_PEP_ID=MMETSP0947-20121206/11938_1 /TAXON_ID=44440 /ORGANISM="Chattonella subsalsa, Strain CCMP2191" /LENGTH=557 /DNA_ID=CAMNT_0005571745 /DNA_START=182 /DNA_END=1855 /DNA_ORIENTATION=+